KKARWSKEHEITKKALNLMIWLNCNDEFFNIIEEFISTKIHELQLLEENKSALEQTANFQKNVHSPNSTNANNSQRNQNKYANCGSYGHNV
ncbi:22036_t:CDS:2, partial [Racocetra persica]